MTRSPRPRRSAARSTSRDPDATAPVRAVAASGPPRRARRAEGRPSRWRLVRRTLLGLTVLGVVGLVGVAWVLAQVPLPPADPPVETTFIYDANGLELAQLNAGENRVSKELGEMSPHLVDAVLAGEDKDFFLHNGIDARSIVRATLADLRGKPLQGGSTITQQYVKVVYTDRERSIMRKLREATLAVKLERRFDKAEILERYLNTIYFGRGAYGAQAASQAYYGIDVSELNEPQAAYLAGLIRAPEVADANRADDPAQVEVAERRRNIVLRAMEEEGHLTEDQVQTFAAQPVADGVLPRSEAVTDRITGAEFGTEYFIDYVKEKMTELYGAARVNGGGLQIHTTLDLSMQEIGYKAVYGPDGVVQQPDTSGALVSIDTDGRILAMVGGRGFADSAVNYATGKGGMPRQVGSTFKPFVLAELVRQGYSVESMIDSPGVTEFPEHLDDGVPLEVSNYGDKSHGRIPITRATALSSNTAYMRMGLDLGLDRVLATANDLGVEQPLEERPSVVLGSAGIPVLQMAEAYLTFATRGEQVDPIAVTRVADADGNEIGNFVAERERVLTEEQADIVNEVLQGVVERGTGDRAAIGRPLAGKTGTTTGNVDAWFVGYTPGLATAVWVGNPAGSIEMPGVTGATIPADIFKSFMEQVVTDEAYGGDFVEPDDLGDGKPFGGRQNAPAPPTTAPRRTTTTEAPPETTTSTVPPPTTTSSAPTTTTSRPRVTTTSSVPTTIPSETPPTTRPRRPGFDPDGAPDRDPAGSGAGLDPDQE